MSRLVRDNPSKTIPARLSPFLLIQHGTMKCASAPQKMWSRMWGQMGSLTTMGKNKHPHNKLTPAAIRNAKPGRHPDGNCLYLDVDDNGAKHWLLRVVIHGRRHDLGLGGISLVSLAKAREEAAKWRKIARDGGDPLAERRKE